jgi:hypothetical protein
MSLICVLRFEYETDLQNHTKQRMKLVFYILWHVDSLLGNDHEISNDMSEMSEELTASSFKVGGKPN